MYFPTAFKGVLTCLKRFKKVFFKVFENSFKIYKKFQGYCNTILELYAILYIRTIFNGNFKRILKNKAV